MAIYIDPDAGVCEIKDLNKQQWGVVAVTDRAARATTEADTLGREHPELQIRTRRLGSAHLVLARVQ